MNRKFVFKQGLRYFFKGGLVSFSGFIVFSAVFFILGIFILVSYNVIKIKNAFEKRFEIMVFLASDAPVEEIMRNICSMEGVKEVKFVSKEEGLKEVKKLLKEDSSVVEILEENPLPNTIRIKLSPFYIQEKNLEMMNKKLQLIDGISEVWIEKNLVLKLKKISSILFWVNTAVFIFVTLSAILVIFVITRLAIYARIREYDLILFYGGTPGTARGPFIVEGMLYGIFGIFFSFLVSYLLYLIVKLIFPYVEFPLHLFLVYVIFGIFTGIIGSSLAAESVPIRK